MNNISGSTFLLLLGGVATIIGAFWSSIESSKQQNKIQTLISENKELTNKTINMVTGGNSYAFFNIGVRHQEGIYKEVGLKLNLNGNLPLSDVSIKIIRIIEESNTPNKSYDLTIIGERHYSMLTHDLFSQSLPLEIIDLENPENLFLKISILSRNGELEQQIRFQKKDNGYYCMATRLQKFSYSDGSFKVETIFDKKDDDYNGDPIWM